MHLDKAYNKSLQQVHEESLKAQLLNLRSPLEGGEGRATVKLLHDGHIVKPTIFITLLLIMTYMEGILVDMKVKALKLVIALVKAKMGSGVTHSRTPSFGMVPHIFKPDVQASHSCMNKQKKS